MLRAVVVASVLVVFAPCMEVAGQSPANRVVKIMDLPEAIEFVRPSVVQVIARVVHSSNSNAPFQVPPRPVMVPLGTGFIVNRDAYVITARHVVEALQTIQAEGSKSLLVGIALPNLDNFKSGVQTINIRGGFVFVECEVIEEDAEHDVALLKMKQNPFNGELGIFMSTNDTNFYYPHKAATLSPDRPRDGERIAVSGYPLSSTVLITTSGYLASAWSYETKTEKMQIPHSPLNELIPVMIDEYLADMHTNPGNSGGPVYSVEQGSVVGVCVSYRTAPVTGGDSGLGSHPLYFNSGLANIVPIHYVIDLLKKQTIKWMQ